MNNEAQQALVKLTEKVGTNIDSIWGTLVKQAPIQSTVECSYILFFGLILSIFWVLFRFTRKKWGDDIVTFSFITGISLTIVYIASTTLSIPRIVCGFTNPEYWALQEIIKSLRSL